MWNIWVAGLFPQCRVFTEVAKGSDHSPLIINLVTNLNQDDGRRKKLFHFEAMWTWSADCEELIRALWNHKADGTTASRILQWQHKVREGLIGWDKSYFGHVRRRVKELEEQLVKLDTDPISGEGRLLRGRLRNELEEFLSREELMWKQRGKAQRLREGDRNTPFFHARASAQRRPEVTYFVLDFLNLGKFDANFNYTFIVLIPKCPSPERMTHFHPISLCNITYKIASKMLDNRMKPILPTIISESQSAFLPGRLISDNVLVTFEINHYLTHKIRGLVGQAALKLDLSKAYDCVE
ncbi:UNVERIFIED_CONTAM: hypothetical protein Slati_0976000 [Sesamum latifolium]|uniref:Reverse transcriptase domain-containing protein n=1 Tax=Sesamum latifolium TaxID=2727402 RepID=A0AAW2XRV9_9LAMI